MPETSVNSGIFSHIRARAKHISRKDAYFIASMGLAISFLLLPLFHNLGIPALVAKFGIHYIWFAFVFVLLAPLGILALSYILVSLPFHHSSAQQLSRYVVIGCFNVALNTSIFNLLILMSGISTGAMVTVFAVITFLIVVTQSFFWSAFWTFKNMPAENRKKQYLRFISVSSIVAVINIAIIDVIVNTIGAPAGIPTTVWANIALLVTILSSFIGNFFGYKFFVFRRDK